MPEYQSGAIYARVSEQDEDLQDPARQLSECREKLEELGVEEIDVYSERGSGADDSRQGLQDLLEAVRDGQYEVICMSEVSRLARRTATAAEFIDACVSNRSIPIHLTDDMIEVISHDDPMSQFFAKMLSLFAEREREQLIRRVKSGMKEAQRQGKWTTKPPKGFTTNDSGILVPEIEEFLAVQTAIERRLQGDSKNSIAKTTGVSRRTLGRIMEDPEKLQLYIDADHADKQINDAINETDGITPADLPDGLEDSIRDIVRDEINS